VDWEINAFLMLANVLRGWVHPAETGAFPRKEARIKGFANLAPSSQTVGSLLRTPWLAKPAEKMI
jgi:hypothetical protein